MRIKHLMSETSGIEYDQVRTRSVLSHLYIKTIILHFTKTGSGQT